MQTLDTRTVCLQLADDLAWLEEHCRIQPDLAVHTNHLRLAAALTRNVVGPFLDRQPARPLHVAVVGGAGSGKSTIANFLLGAVAAEANPQAGFTRHPVAYMDGAQPAAWPTYFGFLGPLRKLPQPSPSSVDEDVYQIRRVSPAGPSLAGDYVVWDCPDMTTWAATGYILRLIEVCGLADVIVFVASDERYNDEVPTQFLSMLVQAGKPVVVVLTKMKPADAPTLIDHFARDIASRLPCPPAAVLAVPFLTAEELADPVRRASQYRMPLLNQISVLADPATARRRTVESALGHLRGSLDGLLSVAKSDLAALEIWRSLVRNGQNDFDGRYFREYLSGEQFHRFDEALVKLIDLLELPGVGKVISGALYVIRTPYRLVKGLFSKMLARPAGPPVPERPVMETALKGWLDSLRAETLRRAGAHPLWTHVSRGFESALPEGVRQTFEDRFKQFQLALADDVEKTSRAIYADLEQDPVKLNTLRGSKFALDVAAIAGTLAMGLTMWDFLWVPLAASVTQMLVEFFGKQYVESQREATRQRQRQLAVQYVAAPLGDWLVQWPASGGSSFEKLKQVLERIPAAIERIGRDVANFQASPTPPQAVYSEAGAS